MTELNLKYLSEQTGIPTKDMSDSYHTFGELYEWRHALFMLALMWNSAVDYAYSAWHTKNHHPDNDPMFELEGKPALLVGLELPGMSVQFHMPYRLLEPISAYTMEIPHAPLYDGSNNPEAALTYLKEFVGVVTE